MDCEMDHTPVHVCEREKTADTCMYGQSVHLAAAKSASALTVVCMPRSHPSAIHHCMYTIQNETCTKSACRAVTGRILADCSLAAEETADDPLTFAEAACDKHGSWRCLVRLMVCCTFRVARCSVGAMSCRTVLCGLHRLLHTFIHSDSVRREKKKVDWYLSAL